MTGNRFAGSLAAATLLLALTAQYASPAHSQERAAAADAGDAGAASPEHLSAD